MTQHDLSLGGPASPTEGDLRLPKAPGVIRQFWARHPWLVDSLIAGFYLAGAGVSSFTQRSGPVTTVAGAVVPLVLAVLCAVALLFRRYRPWVVLGIGLAAMFTLVLVGRDFDFLAALFGLYAVAVYRSTREGWIAYGVVCAVTAVAGITFEVLHGNTDVAPLAAPPINAFFQVIVLALLVVVIAINIGNRRRYLEALIERAGQLARERDQQATIATAAERSRIAREMHDIVSHSLTVMITLADGSAALTATAPERSADAMRQVAETGRSALGDMRRMLGVLSEDDALDAVRQPQPGADDLSSLVETFRGAGLPVRFRTTGTAPDDTGQQLTVYRIVQEALTNVLRYAPAASTVDVVIAYSPSKVTVTVEDDATVHTPAGQGAGRGLLGIRERAGLYGGTVESGPRPAGGWRVHAELPGLSKDGQSMEEHT
ncbi:sensor histidine kinase [Diaminobutyricibacter tongyongensis]|nr:sensor histidine kinase [Diaminobutyricibacter tongyongensis]